MNASRITRLCESLVGAGLVPAERRAEAERALREAWPGDTGFALPAEDLKEVSPAITEDEGRQGGLPRNREALFPQVDPESPAAGAGGHYAGALLLTDLAYGLSCLEEFALRLEQTAARVRMMAAAGIDLADDQDDPEAVVVVTDDPGTAKVFDRKWDGEGGFMRAI